MLAIDNLTSRYGRIEVLHGVSCEVKQGEIVTLVGSNGAGKSTLLRAISGVQPVASGAIRLDGEAINALSAHARVARGIAQVPEGRQVFAPLSVEDNLRLGAYRRRDAAIASDLDEVTRCMSLASTSGCNGAATGIEQSDGSTLPPGNTNLPGIKA